MKNPIQNVLAQNSSGEIMYICGKCGAQVEKEAKICPKCNSRLGKIRCPFCNFKGDIEDFKNDTCPKCGRKKTIDEKEINLTNNVRINKIKTNYLSKKIFWILFFSLFFCLIALVLIFLYHYNII